MRRPANSLRCLLIAVFGLWFGPLAAAETVLHDVAVGSAGVHLDLHHADVHVFIDGSGAGDRDYFVQLIDPSPEPRIAADELLVTNPPAVIEVHRQAPPENSPPPPTLRCDIVLAPGMPLVLRGKNLSVVLEDVLYVRRGGTTGQIDGQEDGEADEDKATVMTAGSTAKAAITASNQAVVRLQVEDSQVEAWGIADLFFAGIQSHLQSEGSHGSLQLEPQESTLHIENHRGALQAVGRGGELTVVDGRGHLEVDWQGGEITLQGGEGKLAGHLTGTALEFEDWRGDVALAGDNSLIYGSDSRSSGSGLDIRGKQLDIRIEEWRGKLKMLVNGGQISGGGWRGKLEISARNNARLDLEPLFGELLLGLRQNSTALLQGVTGLLDVHLEDSELDLEGSTRVLAFDSKRSTASLRGAENIRKLRSSASQISLDLGDLQASRPTVEALEGSDVRIDAPAPCLVDINAPSAVDTPNVEVSGCEQKQLGVGRRRNSPNRIDGSRMTRFVVRMSEDSSVTVEGR